MPARVTGASAALAALLALSCSGAVGGDAPLQARARSLDSEIVVTADPRFAGAISSLVFRGVEHLDSVDNGRLMQSASSFEQMGECYNPTEGGGRDDRGRKSSSSLVAGRAHDRELATTVRMAFWLRPGTAYKGPRRPYCGTRPDLVRAQNSTVLSSHFLHKQVLIGFRGRENVIEYRVAYDVPYSMRNAVFEAVTGYMPARFDRHYLVNRSGELVEPERRDREQDRPVILATRNGRFAMGVYSPELPREGRGYGHFSFPAERTEKWNCVFREPSVEQRRYCYRCYVAVGTLAEVREAIVGLADELAADAAPQRGDVCPVVTKRDRRRGQ
jgi:hypothetical protein